MLMPIESTMDDKSAVASLKVERSQIISRNNEIARYASRKDLQSAIALYQKSLEDGGANTHTYCAMMNAYVRCGDVHGAKTVFESLKARKFEPDVVSFTTMIKGYCMVGDILESIKLFDEMIAVSIRKQKNILPNIRTINTILRGCLASGRVNEAEYVFHYLREINILPDTSSWEYMMSILSQGLILSKIHPMIGRIPKNQEVSAIYYFAARCCCILREWKSAKKYIDTADEELTKEKLVTYDNTTNLISEELLNSRLEDDGIVAGGKRGWKNDEDESRLESLNNYRLHLLEERKYDIDRVKDFIQRESKQPHLTGLIRSIRYFIRTIFFEPSITEDIGIDKDWLESNLWKLGFHRYLERIHSLSNDKNDSLQFPKSIIQLLTTSKSTSKAVKSSKKPQSSGHLIDIASKISFDDIFPDHCLSGKMRMQILQSLTESIIGSGRIDFCKLLSFHVDYDDNSLLTEVYSKPQIRHRGIKLEICAGNGEWAVNQALADPDNDWITIELKYDRVYQTFVRSYFNSVDNLIILGGDANQLIPRYFENDLIDHVFINHPEPPQQTGLELKSQGKHLLTAQFFNEIARILKPNGKISIVTDNSWYAKYLLKEFTSSSFPSSLSSLNISDISDPGDLKVIETNKAIHLFTGTPGLCCGHVNNESTSYFDKLWKHDSNPDRYIILLVKKSSIERHQHRQSTKRFGLFSVTTTTNKNKKIKFSDD